MAFSGILLVLSLNDQSVAAVAAVGARGVAQGGIPLAGVPRQASALDL
jgi:hypothetical protein